MRLFSDTSARASPSTARASSARAPAMMPSRSSCDRRLALDCATPSRALARLRSAPMDRTSRLDTMASGWPRRTSSPSTTRMRVTTPGKVAATATRALGGGAISAGTTAIGASVAATAAPNFSPSRAILSAVSGIDPSACCAAALSLAGAACSPEQAASDRRARAPGRHTNRNSGTMAPALRDQTDETLTRRPGRYNRGAKSSTSSCASATLERVPPCAAMMRATIASPSPAPSLLA